MKESYREELASRSGLEPYAGGGNVAYDARGNMTSGPKPSGPNTGDETTKLHFKYDAWGRLAEIKDDGAPNATIVTQYDASGVNPSPPGHRRTVTRNQISYQ